MLARRGHARRQAVQRLIGTVLLTASCLSRSSEAGLLTAAKETNGDHRVGKVHQAELGTPAVRSSRALSLLLANWVPPGSHFAGYRTQQQDCVNAVKLTADVLAVAV
jgi:hypothetical protein